MARCRAAVSAFDEFGPRVGELMDVGLKAITATLGVLSPPD